MSNRKGEEHLERVNRVLARVRAKRNGKAMISQGDAMAPDGEGLVWENPLSQLMETEERLKRELKAEATQVEKTLARGIDARMEDGALKDRLLEGIEGRVEELALEKYESRHADFLEWIAEEGPNPLAIVKRVICYLKEKRPDLLWDMSFRDLQELLDETHATVHARCKRLFEGKDLGGRKAEVGLGFQAGWKKSPAARQAMSDAQRGNNNRRHGKRRISPPQKQARLTNYETD